MYIYYISMYANIHKSIYISIYILNHLYPYIYMCIYMCVCVSISIWVCMCGLSCSVVSLFDPMDYSLQGSLVHGISQARILEQVAISSPRSSRPRDRTCVPCISCTGRQILHRCVYIHTDTYVKEKNEGNPVICTNMMGMMAVR